jgi:hypothetical protein
LLSMKQVAPVIAMNLLPPNWFKIVCAAVLITVLFVCFLVLRYNQFTNLQTFTRLFLQEK